MQRATTDRDGFPCPCCGHRALPSGPGDYELCPVCFWEDDGAQLRYPMSADGANGISLLEAQQRYRRHGAMHQDFRRKVRRPRPDEPLDPGWRPFDPEVDWTHPALSGDRWPRNLEALYYWRDTYWNGDPGRLPSPTTEPGPGDRLVAHLRLAVPEIEPAVAALEWRFGSSGPMSVCGHLAELAVGSYRGGDEALGMRIVMAVLPALDETSDAYAPNCVLIGFLEHEAWHEPAMQPFIDRWPAELRAEIRRQQAFRTEGEAETDRAAEARSRLWRTAPGQPVSVVEESLRALGGPAGAYPGADLHVALTARVMTDRRWLFKHPLAALRLAWRYRHVQSPLRTLRWLGRPRFAG